MTIREASKKVGISAENLRFYEKIGLLPPVPRKESGIREYDAKLLEYIAFVMQLKKTGVSLEALIEYMQLAVQGRATIRAQKSIWEETRKNLIDKIQQLNDCLAQVDLRLVSCVADAKQIEENFSSLWLVPLKKIS